MTSHRQKSPKAAHPCFLTLAVLGGVPVFSHFGPAQKVIDALRSLQQARRLTIYGYVLLEDQFHLLASAVDLTREIAELKSLVARQILEALDTPDLQGLLKRLRRFQEPAVAKGAAHFWQEGGPPPEPLRSEDAMRAKLDFIHGYPVKRGYAAEPAVYRYSSAANYAGQPGLLPVTTEW
jgi:putative transposase